MKCPKCGFNSFDYLEDCKKCGNDLKEFKSKFSLRSLIFPGSEKVAPVMGDSLAMDESLVAPAGDLKETPAASDLADEEKTVAASAGQDAGEDPFDLDWNEDSAEEFDFTEEKDAAEPVSGQSGRDFDFDAEDMRNDGTAGETAAEPTEAAAEADLSWEDDPLPDLSLAGDEELEFEDLGEEPPLDLAEDETPGEEPAAAGDSGLPELDDLDFEELTEPEEIEDQEAVPEEGTWGEISFEEEEEEEAKEEEPTSGAKGEGPRDPFDQPEPVAAGQAPDTDSRAFAQHEATDSAIPAGNSEGGDMEAGDSGALLNAGEPDAIRPAGLVARFGALCLDLFLVAGVLLLFLVSATHLLAPAGDSALLPSFQILLTLSVPFYLLLVIVCFLYFTAFHFFAGQTPGKMLFGIRVEGYDGQPLLFSEAFLRSVGGLASLVALGIGFLLACFDPQGRGWNDRLAGTRVVVEPAEK